mgnify:CR=1 FL=1
MEQFGIEQQDFSNEHKRSQEIITLEHRVMQKYFEIAGISGNQRVEWANANGAALRQLVDKEPEFLYEFSKKTNAAKEEFEEKLTQYL